MNFCKDCRHYSHITGAPNNCIEIHECRQPESVKKFNLVTGEIEPASMHRPDAYENRASTDCGPAGRNFEPKFFPGRTTIEQSLETVQRESLKLCKDCRFFEGYSCKHLTSMARVDPVTGEQKFHTALAMRRANFIRVDQCGQEGRHFIHKHSITALGTGAIEKPIELAGAIEAAQKASDIAAAEMAQHIKGPCTHCGSPDHWRPDCPRLIPAIEDMATVDATSYMRNQRRMIFIKHPNPWWKRIFSPK